jgi:hypothetical protein
LRRIDVSTDIYFARDIARVLRAASFAGEGGTELALDLLGDPELCAALDAAGISHEQLLSVYRRGYRTALVSVGLAFGLVPESGVQAVRVTGQRENQPAGLLFAEAT